MRLASFQIKNYKIIDDTGQVKADKLVTALVGKIESGKSSIMRAMWKSRSVAELNSTSSMITRAIAIPANES
jgi:predicted ATP-dependent endonuclease of OLD family